MTITIEDIMKTANSLMERGEKPTLDLMRKTMKEGSYTIICRGLKEWRHHRCEAAPARHAPIPEGIITSSQALINKLWE